jgi:peptidylprolyl isomerase
LVTKKPSIVVFALIGMLTIVLISGMVSNVAGANQFGSSADPDDTVVLVTTMGNITIELFGDMPITSGNFKNLTQFGVYDGTIFHRVISNFVIQGGGNTHYPYYVDPRISAIRDELPNKHSNIRESVAMANTGAPNSAKSQFYINLVDNSYYLDANYTVFGKVIQGMDVVDSISHVQTDADDRPIQDVTILKALMAGPVPEFSQLMLCAVFMATTLLAAVVCRGKRALLKL